MCGAQRKMSDILSKAYDIYLKDSTSGSLVRVGLCRSCFSEKETHCLDAIKTKLHESEVEATKDKANAEEFIKVFEDARYVGRMSYNEYWDEVSRVNPKTTSEYVEIIQNERD